MRVENLRAGFRSFARWLDSFGGEEHEAHGGRGHRTETRTSSILPSILSCHAGMFSPVSRLGFAASPSAPSCCHTWPETVWLKNIRSVLVACPRNPSPAASQHTRLFHRPKTPGAFPRHLHITPKSHRTATHRDDPLQRIVDLDAFARHRPVELALHLEQVPVHRRVLRELGRLQERVRQVLVRDLALPVIRGRRGALAERGAGGEVGGEGVLRGRLWGLHGASTSASASAARGTAILLRASEAVKGARAKAAACKRGSCVRLAKGEEALVAVRGQTGRRNTANTLVPSRVYDTWQPPRFDSQCGHYLDLAVCQPPLRVQDCSSQVSITLH